jgi:hypothetical protein
MILKKILAASTALALAATPLSAPALGSPGQTQPRPTAEDVDGQAQFMDGFAAHWIVIGIVVLAVLVFVVLDDDDPVSP